MTLICKSCGAENAADAASCWKCEAAGETLRGRASKAALWILLGVVIAGALGGAAWWGLLREGAPYAGLLSPAATVSASSTPRAAAASPPATPSQASAEAALLADPVDGPFFREFRELLPGDYSAVMGYLLVQVPDPARDMQRFDDLLGERLGVMRTANAQDIAGAADGVLDEMAGNMLSAMRAPEYCQAAIDPDMDGLDIANTATRRLANGINISIVRAIASGRETRAARAAPTSAQVASLHAALEQKLYARHWEAFSSGGMDALPPDEQCTIHVGVWDVIAGYPPALSAVWTAHQMAQPAQ